MDIMYTYNVNIISEAEQVIVCYLLVLVCYLLWADLAHYLKRGSCSINPFYCRLLSV